MAEKNVETIRVLDAHETPTLPGHHAGYVLRILGPMELAGKYEWYELTLAPGGELASQAHDPGTSEHLTVLHGASKWKSGRTRRRSSWAARRATRPTTPTSSATSARPRRRRCWW
jgi:hypothetical protein